MKDPRHTLVRLLDAHGARLHRLLSKLTANQDVADDLLQELFLRQFESKAIVKAPNQEAYLFRSAINLAFDWRRRDRTDQELPLLEIDVACGDELPADQMVIRETTRQVLEAMQQLSDRDRELLSLRYIQGESNEWIAQRWGSNPHQIRSRCSKALARLRKILGRDAVVSFAPEDHR